MKRHLSPEEMFPAGESGYRVQHIQLSSTMNVRIVEAGEGSSPPVMLLHGWGCSAFAFYRNIFPIAASGFRVIVPDLKGHGLSDKPGDSSNYTTAAMVQHISEIADALHLKGFAIAGHSMGAGLALRFAIANPRRVTGIGLLSPVGTSGLPGASMVRMLTPKFSLGFWRMLNTRWMTRLFLRIAYGEFGSPSETEVDEYWAPAQYNEFTTALRHLMHKLNWGPIYVGGLDAYNIPILIMSGSRDHLCRRKTREHLKKTLRTPPQVVEGAGHLILSEVPDRVNAALIGLLSTDR